ncbi:MAG: protein kinase [Desulfobacterales bacterium]|nr:protein kinase [Desulfobacterales bacterium]
MAFPEIGDTIDIFILRSQLHKGAMSAIFLAEDLLSRKTVVLKVPFGDILNNPILLYHYQNEDRISRMLDHPGIVRFIHRQRSRQYIIMEHVAAKDLRSAVGENRPLGLEAALSLMGRLCDVVGYLHERSVVHLDLKPENILCLKDGSIKLVDFGLASCVALPDLLALDFKNPQGTAWYISPEQLLGERSDPRCDIYSMGMLLYEMLTGRLPWPRSNKVSVARRRLRHEPVPPRYHNPEIPPQIQSIILCAIARHAGDRYQSVVKMQNDLKAWQTLSVTETGTNRKKPSFWQYILPRRSPRIDRSLKNRSQTLKTPPQVICALADSPENNTILAEVKRRASLSPVGVTLVHVIEEESDSPLRRYGIKVEGERLMGRIEEAVQILRRFGIDPGIRLVRGAVSDVLPGLCKEMNAKLMVLGPSGKKKGVFRGGSLFNQLKKRSPCPVVTADPASFLSAARLAGQIPDQLTAEQIIELDILLVDLWYSHLYYHTHFIYHLLLQPEADIDTSEKKCEFGKFLAAFKPGSDWEMIFSHLRQIHERFHRVARQMFALKGRDHTGLHHLYARESLPLSLKLKNELGEVARCIRSHLDNPPPVLPFLKDDTCPFKVPDTPRYGPLLRLFNIDRDLSALIQRHREKTASFNDREMIP